jgi:hypothetical protein
MLVVLSFFLNPRFGYVALSVLFVAAARECNRITATLKRRAHEKGQKRALKQRPVFNKVHVLLPNAVQPLCMS